ARRHRVLLALKPSEQAPRVVLEGVEIVVDVGADATDRSSVAVGEEVLDPGVVEERILALVEPFLLIHQQRRDPVGLVTIQPPRQLDERVQRAPGRYGPDLDCHPRATLYAHLARRFRQGPRPRASAAASRPS